MTRATALILAVALAGCGGEPTPKGDQPGEASEKAAAPADAKSRGDVAAKGGRLDSETLLRGIDAIFTAERPATVNVMKAERQRREFLAAINAFRGRGVAIVLPVVHIDKTHIHTGCLTLDPKYDEKDEANTRRQLQGLTPLPLKPSPFILFDFSGADRGQDRFQHPSPEEFRELKIPMIQYDRLPHSRFDAKAVERLEAKDKILIVGTIASVTEYGKPSVISRQPSVLVSIRPDNVEARFDR